MSQNDGQVEVKGPTCGAAWQQCPCCCWSPAGGGNGPSRSTACCRARRMPDARAPAWRQSCRCHDLKEIQTIVQRNSHIVTRLKQEEGANIYRWSPDVPLTLLTDADRCRHLPTSSKQVEVRVSPQHPEAIVVPAEGLHSGPFGHIPHPDALVLRVGQDELLTRVEDGTGHVVVVTAACIELPRLGFWTVGEGEGGKRDRRQAMLSEKHHFSHNGVSLWTLTADLPFILQILTCLSSAPDTMRGMLGWKAAQLTPRSWP